MPVNMVTSKIDPKVVWRIHHNGYSATIDGKSISITDTFEDTDKRYVLINEGRRLFGWPELHRVEFKVGQEVTFHPYIGNDPIPAIVAEVDCGDPFPTVSDHRVFYRLTRTPKGPTLKSICTGKCIKESVYYEATPVRDAFK